MPSVQAEDAVPVIGTAEESAMQVMTIGSADKTDIVFTIAEIGINHGGSLPLAK